MERTIPRPEHPQPQMERKNWRNLNGEWDFAFDFGNSGLDRRFQDRDRLDRKILVPFCPESELSGIGYRDFIPAVWYKRDLEVTKEQLDGRILLHFGAVDYYSIVFVNGRKAGEHRGGYTSFTLDITRLCAEGRNRLTVYAADDTRSGLQPRGKQCPVYASCGCDYTRTTGIWQTVWTEYVPASYIREVKYTPNAAEGTLAVEASVCGRGTLEVSAFFEGRPCGKAAVRVESGFACLTLGLEEVHLWQPGEGKLYDLLLRFGEDEVKDEVKSYAGLREVCLDGRKVLINGKAVFQRLVLDQGFYPDGIYTAPDEEALVRDILLSREAGFNGARLHQKVFEPRFLYHCDRLGYLVWGEMGNWGLDLSRPETLEGFLGEWTEAVRRDINHPAIVGWCPFNETWDQNGRQQLDSTLAMVYRMTKLLDPARPCIDTSGNYHVVTEIYDVHDYEQNVETFAAHYEAFRHGGEFYDAHSSRQRYTEGLPMFVSEYGGIKWNPDADVRDAWGYGAGPETETEFIERYRGLTDVLLDNPYMFGFCYTQLYDVEQETNGLYTYDRRPKFDMRVFRAINSRRAACEDEEDE
ncbi:MAG TPA: beta-galactosidase [Firmicutes bacterium]|nr:beta-galactosidase [Bacillota bacterium]